MHSVVVLCYLLAAVSAGVGVWNKRPRVGFCLAGALLCGVGGGLGLLAGQTLQHLLQLTLLVAVAALLVQERGRKD